MNQLGGVVDKFLHEMGNEGAMNGDKTRRRLGLEKRRRDAAAEKELDDMIQTTAQTSAIQAINLSNLLKKKWTEEKDSYVILSKIRTFKQRSRLNDMNSNRYIV